MNWSRKVRDRDRARFAEIEKKVADVEELTDGEIVTVLVGESHDYAFYEFRTAIAAGLLTLLVTLLWLLPIEAFLRSSLWDYHPAYLVLASGGLAFVIMLLVYLALNIPCLDRRVIPGRVMSSRVQERALRAFAEEMVSHTEKRLGLLVFVSILEQRVELMADIGLNRSIAPEVWHQIVREMSGEMKTKGLIDGILLGITRAGTVLAEHFPRGADRQNRLEDRVTLLES